MPFDPNAEDKGYEAEREHRAELEEQYGPPLLFKVLAALPAGTRVFEDTANRGEIRDDGEGGTYIFWDSGERSWNLSLFKDSDQRSRYWREA